MPGLPWPGRSGLAAVLAGAVANLTDRAADGVVTDYLHTGWWLTFNLADTLIIAGAATIILTSLRREPPPRSDDPAPGSDVTGSDATAEAGAANPCDHPASGRSA